MTQQLKAAPLLPCLKLAKLGKLGWLIDRIEKLLPIPARSTLILLCHAESLQILGDFYLKKGQRARLPQELGSRILRLLDEASAALPAWVQTERIHALNFGIKLFQLFCRLWQQLSGWNFQQLCCVLFNLKPEDRRAIQLSCLSWWGLQHLDEIASASFLAASWIGASVVFPMHELMYGFRKIVIVWVLPSQQLDSELCMIQIMQLSWQQVPDKHQVMDLWLKVPLIDDQWVK